MEAVRRTDDDICPHLRFLALCLKPGKDGNKKIPGNVLQPAIPTPGKTIGVVLIVQMIKTDLNSAGEKSRVAGQRLFDLLPARH